MATYTPANIEVTISEKCFEKAKYIYFGKLTGNGNTYLSKIVFDKRFTIDDNKILNTFPKLYSNSQYNKLKLNLDVNDSYLGSKITNNENTIISVIYPVELITEDYKFIYITPESTESIEEITIPLSYSYNFANNATKLKDKLSAVNRILSTTNTSNWLYLIDCQSITNVWCSYIIHFYLSNTKEDSTNDIIIKLHTSEENAHLDDLSNYGNLVASDKIYSKNAITNALGTTFNKMNGLISTDSFQHKLKFIGTDVGYDIEDLKSITENDINNLFDEQVDENGNKTNYKILKDYINDIKVNEEYMYDFGEYEINSIQDFNESYIDSILIENYLKKNSIQYTLKDNKYQVSKTLPEINKNYLRTFEIVEFN